MEVVLTRSLPIFPWVPSPGGTFAEVPVVGMVSRKRLEEWGGGWAAAVAGENESR